MKLVRFGEPGRERPGVWIDQAPELEGRAGILDVRGMAFDLRDYDRFFFERHGLARVRNLLTEPGRRVLPAERFRLGPPVAPGGQVICVGKNYADHAREFDATVPSSPILFSKAPGTLIGTGDPIRLSGSDEADYEAELAVVIGRTAHDLAEEQALDAVAGYTLLNDVTDRRLQRTGGQWFAGKSRDSFCPVGPALVTPEAMPDPRAIPLSLSLNGTTMQEGNTGDMIFSIRCLIAHLSRILTLRPGDLLATGTPAGVGFARTPPVFLKSGDVVAVESPPIGRLVNPVE